MVGGRIHMILGLKYQSIYPIPIHTMNNGLTLFESRLRPSEPGLLACIGGPVKYLESICNIAGEDATFSYISCLVNNMNDYKFTVDFFPKGNTLIPNKEKLVEEGTFDHHTEEHTEDTFDYQTEVNLEESNEAELLAESAKCKLCNHFNSSHSVKQELDKYFEIQNAGLGTDYKCPACRNCRQCLKGPG